MRAGTFILLDVLSDFIVIHTASRATAFTIVLCSAELIAVDTDGISRLLDLLRLRAHAPADLGQKKIESLLEGVPDARPRK